LNFTEKFVDGSSNVSYVVMGGHDDNIVAIHSALGFVNDNCILANFKSYWENNTIPHP